MLVWKNITKENVGNRARKLRGTRILYIYYIDENIFFILFV